MRHSVRIRLVKRSFEEDADAVRIPFEDSREVYAYCDSVSAAEFFEGSRSGLRPSYRFVMNRFDYDDENIVEYDGNRYKMYRNYINGDWIELYCERSKGFE